VGTIRSSGRLHSSWRLGSALAAGILGVGAALVSSSPAHAAEVTFDDEALQAAVNQAMNAIDGGNRNDTDPIDDDDDELTEITHLNVAGKNINSLTGIESLTGLQELIMQSSNLDDAAMEHLADHAEDLPNLELLNLSTNQAITDQGATAIAQATGWSLSSLALTNTGVEDADAVAAQIAEHQPELTALMLGGLPLTDDGAAEIAQSLTSLESLTLSSTSVTDAGIEALTDSLEDLDTLWLNNTAITSTGLAAIADLPELEYLYLRQAAVTDITPLAAVTTLRVLDLSDQQVHLDSVTTGESTANPVRDEDDDVVPVTSSVSGFTYHSTSDSWEFDSPGSMALEWSTTADFGDTIDFDTEEPGVTFSGTLHQSVGMSLPAPDVTQAECSEDAAVVGPRVTHDENEHIVEFVYHANDAPVDDLSEVVLVMRW